MYRLGLTLTIIGIFLWPLLLIGIPLIIIGKNKEDQIQPPIIIHHIDVTDDKKSDKN